MTRRRIWLASERLVITVRMMSNYQNENDALAKMFGALGNPHRLTLFRRLCTCCVPGTSCSMEEAIRVCVGDLGAELDIAPSTVSHHLKTLKNAGLIETARRGKRVECWVEPDTLRRLSEFFVIPTPDTIT